MMPLLKESQNWNKNYPSMIFTVLLKASLVWLLILLILALPGCGTISKQQPQNFTPETPKNLPTRPTPLKLKGVKVLVLVVDETPYVCMGVEDYKALAVNMSLLYKYILDLQNYATELEAL